MARTLVDVEAELVTVNAAIQQLMQGKRVTQLEVGSGNFRRRYNYQEISMDSLKALRDELIAERDSLSITPVAPTFRTNATIPMVVGKDIF